MSQFLGSLALLPIEKLVNAVIARDPHVVKKLGGFDGKSIEVVSTTPSFTLSLRFEDEVLKLSAIDSQTLGIEVDARISGKAEELLSLLLQDPEKRALADSGIDIEGDATLIQDLQVTLASLDISWQDYLTPFLGDIISQELGEIETRMRDWSTAANDSLRRNVRDFLSEEARLAPSALEVDSFSNRLDRLRLSLDRVSARAELFERRLTLLSSSK